MNNIIYDPNFIPNQPIFPSQNNERLIPFLGGALIGGLGGAAIANNQPYYNQGYYYPYYYAQPVNYGYYSLSLGYSSYDICGMGADQGIYYL